MGWELPETFRTSGGTVRWARFGAGPPVVLLHGTPFSSVVWRDLAHTLAHTHEVYVWDMLGYGSSEMRADQDVSLAAQGRIFAALLEMWGLREPAVVAHDFGGAVALRAALLSGARYQRLALLDPVALAPWGSAFFDLARDNHAAFSRIPHHLHEAMVRAYVATASHPGLTARTLDELVRPWLGDTGRAAFYRQIAQADQTYTDEIEPRYAELDLPVLVGWGTHDGWIPPDRAGRLAAAIPGAELHWFEGAGHLVQLDAAAQVAGSLAGFLGPAGRGSHRADRAC